jgi:hypothetical protein
VIWVSCYLDVSRSRFLPRSQRKVTRMFPLIHCPNGGIFVGSDFCYFFFFFFSFEWNARVSFQLFLSNGS